MGKEDGHGAPAVKGAQYCHLWMPELIEIPVSASSRSDQAGPRSLRPKIRPQVCLHRAYLLFIVREQKVLQRLTMR